MSTSPVGGDTIVLNLVREIIGQEAEALARLATQVGAPYERAVDLIRATKGKVVTTGVGKSGLVARKIASTLSSTGTPAVFLHPSEALHGDLGLVSGSDVILAIGKSGESDELTAVLPALKRIGPPIIAVTANERSTLARAADVVLLVGVGKEACPFDLVPTTSTMASMAVGDALAMTLMRLKKFEPQDFARVHPGGQLGRRLLLKVEDLMIPLERCPVLDAERATIEQVIAALGSHGLGIVLFSADGHALQGIVTDGDVRRLLSQHKAKVFDIRVADIVNAHPRTLQKTSMAAEALRAMETPDRPLNVMPVLDGSALAGLVRLHELVRVS